MARKRVNGRFVREDELPGEAGTGNLVGAPRPKNCRLYTRARLAEELPAVTRTLLREAKKGSIAHLKLLVQISGLDKGSVTPEPKKHKGRNLEQILMDEWAKEQAEEAKEAAKEIAGE